MGSGYPSPTPEMARRRRDMAPAQQAAFDAFGKAVFAEGTLSAKMKQIIAWPSPTSRNARTASAGTPRRRCTRGRRNRN